MRKFVISLAAAGTALAFATPSAAQYYPQPQGYGYGYNGYGQNNYGQVRALKARIDGIQRQIENLRARRAITRNEASNLRSESRDLEQRLYRIGRNGLNSYEMRNVEYRIARLEQHVRRDATDGRGWNRGYGSNGYNNATGYYANRDGDHDRDGRDDRYEDDHGYDRDD